MKIWVLVTFLILILSYQNCSDISISKKASDSNTGGNSGGSGGSGGGSGTQSKNLVFLFADINTAGTSYLRTLDLQTDAIVSQTLTNSAVTGFCGSLAAMSSIGDLDGDSNAEIYVEMCGVGFDFVANPKQGTSQAVDFYSMGKTQFWYQASGFVNIANQPTFLAGWSNELVLVSRNASNDYQLSQIVLPNGYDIYYSAQTVDSNLDADAIPDILAYVCLSGIDCETVGYEVLIISSATRSVLQTIAINNIMDLPLVENLGLMETGSIFGDWNGDGNRDYARLNTVDSRIDFYMQGGSNTFKTFFEITGQAGSSIRHLSVIGDYNSDGADDFAFILGNNGYIYSLSTNSILKTFAIPRQGVPANFGLSDVTSY